MLPCLWFTIELLKTETEENTKLEVQHWYLIPIGYMAVICAFYYFSCRVEMYWGSKGNVQGCEIMPVLLQRYCNRWSLSWQWTLISGLTWVWLILQVDMEMVKGQIVKCKMSACLSYLLCRWLDGSAQPCTCTASGAFKHDLQIFFHQLSCL